MSARVCACVCVCVSVCACVYVLLYQCTSWFALNGNRRMSNSKILMFIGREFSIMAKQVVERNQTYDLSDGRYTSEQCNTYWYMYMLFSFPKMYVYSKFIPNIHRLWLTVIPFRCSDQLRDSRPENLKKSNRLEEKCGHEHSLYQALPNDLARPACTFSG